MADLSLQDCETGPFRGLGWPGLCASSGQPLDGKTVSGWLTEWGGECDR